METSDLNQYQYILEPLIRKALIDSMKVISGKRALQEPDYVASLTINFTRDFYQILKTVFPNYEFAISSVFCHQKPIVDIKESKKPELGDILFVYAYEKDNGSVLYNSLLLQAKISFLPFHRISSNELHQLKLYQKWPKFTYLRAGVLNGTTRDIFPKSINDGAQYLLIDNNPATNGFFDPINMYPMGCAIPDKLLQTNQSLSWELIDFLKFKSGRVFDEDPLNTKDDWSKMIWDLLEIGATNYSKRSNIKYSKFPRGVTSCSPNFKSQNTKFYKLLKRAEQNNYQNDFPDDSGEGVSVVFIESRNRRTD